MNRIQLSLAALAGALMPLVFDSALKGAALLAVAALSALGLYKASAAARHLVWLIAVVALLIVPVLSFALPGWRVLPNWTANPLAEVAAAPLAAPVMPPVTAGTQVTTMLPTLPIRPEPAISELPLDGPRPQALTVPIPHPESPIPDPARTWRDWLPVAWAAGFGLLALRLLAAHLLLRRAARECATLKAPPDGFIASLFAAACAQLGIRQRVLLLLDEKRTIPVVWGVFRPRLLLPAEAREWSKEQLHSVLLHELAHIQRRDTLVQWIAQIACALHWFNPLVWFAAWRLHVERERACDDLVLASGVRPSDYAKHLLHVATRLTPARWTQACGLAMARKSSLEGRLRAVLSEKLNRRSVTSALAAAALILGAVVAIPVAMLRAADDKWIPHQVAHIGTNDFSAYCVHDGKDAAFVIAYHGDFGSAAEGSSNAKTRTWIDAGTLTAKKPSIALGFHRTQDAPGKLSISVTPAEARDLSKPAPPPRDFGQKEYDLAKGRVFLLTDNGTVRQFDIATPVVSDHESAKKLAALIAAIPPQEREDVALTPNPTGKLAPETIAKLKWGEPVNGLRMALAYPPALGDALLGKKPHFELVVQNVAEKDIHFLASDDAPNPRELNFRADHRTVLVLADKDTAKAEWHLQPGQCGVLRMFTKEERDDDGKTVSAGIEGDLSKIDRNHAVAEMEVVKAPEGAWTGKLITGQTRGSADVAVAPAPMHKDARSLYEIWQRHARLSGDIPGALIGELAAAVKVFIGYNPTWETVPKLNKILPRLDATCDWKSADAIALLDAVATVQDSPLQTAAEKMASATIRKGEALPKKFAGVAWGETQPNGLRAAWVLEPAAAEHRMGTAVKARLLVQNTGTVPVMTRVPTWHQGGVSARDAAGAEVQASGLEWTTIAQLVTVRLAPGEFIEINTPGVGLGKDAGRGPWAGPRVGSNVLAKDGVELTLTHGPLPLDGSGVGMSEDAPHLIGPGWWQAHIKARLARELPLPANGAKRTHLLDRAVRELFGNGPTPDEIAAFATDQTDGAFDALVQRLAARADVVEFAGSLPTAPAKFRVLPADPQADKQPRVVLGPGEYPLPSASAERGNATLKIVGRPVGERRTNDAQLLFEAVEFTGILPPDPHKLELPDGWGTWAIVCRPGAGFFYLLHKGGVRKIDYSAPRKVTDTPANDLPAEFRDEVKRQLDIAGVQAESQAEVFEKPAPAAETPEAPANTPEPKTGAEAPAMPNPPLQPKRESAQLLLKNWQTLARTDGKIPGGLIAALAERVELTLSRDGLPTAAQGPKLAPLLAALRRRMDGSHDWPPAEAVAMLDELTAITTEPVNLANRPFEFDEWRKISPGHPLPKELESAAWGKSAENGLRAAWLLEPAPVATGSNLTELLYPLGSVLKARVLFHNTGKEPVVFKTETWHQHDGHTARDAKGAEIPVKATWFTGITPMATFRLAPGEYCEVTGHGIAIGAGKYEEEHSLGSVGAVIEAKEGDTVTLSHSVDTETADWTRPGDPKDPLELWKATIAERVANEAPMPASSADREQLIRRVTLDIFGELPTPEEVAAFTADNAPDALAKLVARLQAKPRVEPFAGKLPTGETKFRVIAADPNAAKAPRTATGPGRYVLGEGVHLQVRQVTEGDKRTNTAEIIFLSPDPKKESPHKPYKIGFYVPDATYAFVWQRGVNTLWVTEISEGEPIRFWLLGSPDKPGPQKVTVRAFDFSNPADVKLTHVTSSENGGGWSWGKIVPAAYHQPVLDALGERGKRLRDFIEPQKEKPTAAAAPKQPKLPDDAYAKPGVHSKKFREEDAKRPGVELMGAVLEPSKPEDRDKEPLVLGVRTASDAQWRIGGTAKVGLVVRNRTGGIGRDHPGSDVKFAFSDMLDSGLSIVVIDEAGKEHQADVARTPSGFVKRQQMLLPVAHVATVREFTLRFDAEKRDVGDSRIAAFHLPPGKYTLRCKWSDASPADAHEGEWTGELVSGEHKFTLAAAGAPAAETPKSGTRIQPATEQKLKWGEPANGLRMALAWPPTLGEPGMGDAPEFYLVVQNVSEKAVRLTANDAAPNPRMLNLFDATIVSRSVDDVTIPGDWLLQPREAAFVRLFHAEQKFEDGRTISVLKENVVSTLGQYSYTAEMSIGKAPAGAWTGKLVTGATRGSADMLEAGKPIALRSAPPMSWGVPKDGLRGAWRIVGEMRTGGQAKAELWVWNASIDVVKLSWTERADIGLAVMMSDGTNPAREAPVTRDKKDFQLHYLVLPAGQAVKLKEFAVRLGSAPNDAPAGTVSLPLTPGDWTLQAKWSDSRHIIDAAPEWHGVLDTGELKLKVTPEGATVAEAAAVKAKWPPVRQKTEWSDEFLAHSKAVAEARGTPDATPEDLIVWGAEENGLRAGLLMAPRVTLGGQLPTRMVLRNVTNDVRELGLSLSLNRLTATAQTPDGKLLQVHKTQLRGGDALYKVTLMPGEQVEFEGPPVQFGVEHDGETKKVKMPKYPICGVETGAGKVHVHFEVEAKTGEAVVEVVAAKAGEDAGKPKGKTAAKLDPGTEAQLDWGEVMNGLRGAVVIRSAKPGAAPGIFLALQNVSYREIHFDDRLAGDKQRTLYVSSSGRILFALTGGDPRTELVFPPGDIDFLPIFPPGRENEEAVFIEGIRKDSLQIWRVALNIENAPDDAWKGKLTTGETRCTATEGPQPKSKEGRALFKLWQSSARLNGDIPGGLLARLHDKVKEFIRNNTGDASGDPYAKKMAPLEPRFDVAGDWKPAEVVALMDDIAATSTIPLETTLNHLSQNTLRHGQPLPVALKKVDWGEPLDSGLRMAFLLEPRAAKYHLGTEVKARILLHNSGKVPVAFIAGSFHQPGHKAKLADGSELKLDATDWLTRSVPQAYRLAPGEYIELNTPGLGIGAHTKDLAEWSDVRAGSWILCSDGDEVTFLPGGIMLSGDDSTLQGLPRPWWPDFITERLAREVPVPLNAKEREYLLYRVVRDLFGTAPSTTEGDAFAADKSPDALKNLALLLSKHPYRKQCQGVIQAGETKFRVLPADPDAAKRPRVAMNPGRYTLGNEVRLVVTRRPQGGRIINEGSVTYYPPGKDNIPHDLKLPDGYDTWAAAWAPGATVLWVKEFCLLRKVDFTDPTNVTETRYEGFDTTRASLPKELGEALHTALPAPGKPEQIQQAQPPATPAPAADTKPKGAYIGPAKDELEKGQVAIKAKDRDAALTHFLKALELDPNCAPAHFNLAVIFATDNPPVLIKARIHYKTAKWLGTPRDTGLDKLFAPAAEAPAKAH